jgi:hypothetical protein
MRNCCGRAIPRDPDGEMEFAACEAHSIEAEEAMVKIVREADAVPVAEVAKKHGSSDATIYVSLGGIKERHFSA